MIRVNRFWLPLVGFLVIAGIFLVALQRTPRGERVIPSVLIGRPAPAFDLPSVLDPQQRVSIEQFKGRWTLLNVWATWCAECRIEHPLLLELQREGKLAIVGLDYKDEDAAAIEWLKQLGNPYDAVAADPEGRAAIDYGVYGAPESFLIDPQGVVVRKQVGAINAEVWERDFAPLLKEAS